MSSCNARSPSAPSSCTRSAPSQASGLRPSASEPGRTPMQESRDRASSDGRAPLVASLLESARTKGRKMLCASPDHQLVHVQAAVCGPQNRQYQTSGTTCRIRVEWHRFRLSCLPAPVGLLILDRGSIPNRLEEAVVIEPPDPVERGKLHVFEASPGPAAVNHLRLEKTDDGFSQRIVVAVALASHRGLDACLGQPLGVANRKVLDPTIAVMD